LIPSIASIIDGEVENFEDLYKNLCEARKKPHVMDDMIIVRAINNPENTWKRRGFMTTGATRSRLNDCYCLIVVIPLNKITVIH
jgi:hypothetical protein